MDSKQIKSVIKKHYKLNKQTNKKKPRLEGFKGKL